jgi:hypothetical protein
VRICWPEIYISTRLIAINPKYNQTKAGWRKRMEQFEFKYAKVSRLVRARVEEQGNHAL